MKVARQFGLSFDFTGIDPTGLVDFIKVARVLSRGGSLREVSTTVAVAAVKQVLLNTVITAVAATACACVVQ
jgi:hypothetical protein